MTTHSQACILAYEHYQKELADWLSRWGYTYCQECKSYGVLTDTYDPSPAGVGLSSGWMESEEPCSCTSLDNDREQPRCPRCGTDWEISYDGEGDPICLITEQGFPCPSCEWNWGKGLDDTLPVEPECFCDEGPDTEDLAVTPDFLILDELPSLMEGRS